MCCVRLMCGVCDLCVVVLERLCVCVWLFELCT